MRTAIFIVLALTIPLPLYADTLHVPAQYNTIQEAVNVAATLDTVLVAPGTYVENLDFRGKAITVKSSSGALLTVIDGRYPWNPDYQSTVVFHNGEGADSVLDGFTISNGRGSLFEVLPNQWDLGGGGIFCEETSPTIMNNILTTNKAEHTGGGICCHNNACPVITNNIIMVNYAKKDAGGIYCSEGSSPLVTNNSIYSNNSGGYGGGIHCHGNSEPTISYNEIFDNVAEDGGGISCILSSPIIDNNIITGNQAFGTYGGGILSQSSNPEITNNHILYNELKSSYGGMGGGIACEDSSGLIRNNLILGNESPDQGGGISCSSFSHPTIEENRILQNIAIDGGGIDCFLDCNPLIADNLISENEAISQGGGLRCHLRCTPLIRNNSISDNTAGAGGGIYCYSNCHAEITNNIISRNNSNGYGGGICISYLCDLIITNNVFYKNESDTLGGGLGCSGNSHPIVVNTIFWENVAPVGKEAALSTVGTPASLTISYSIVQAGKASIHVDSGSQLNWGTGMMDTDPRFVSPDQGDFHLTFDSPCKNTGDNAALSLPCNDFEGDPRIAYGTVDMGADEFHPHLYYIGEATPSGRIKVICIGIPATAVNGIVFGLKVLNPPLPCDYGAWYMDNPFQIYAGFGAIPANGVFVIPGTIPAIPAEPYTFYLQAAIDSWLTNLCTVHVE